MAVGGLIYCPFAIIEMRMSPQFHQWVYGYNTGDFIQTIRYGGYRPKVFMLHGLVVARFFLMATVALFALCKTRRNLFGVPIHLWAWFQLVVLVLCRSTGAAIQAVIGVIFVSFVKPKRQLLFASVLSLATLLYPVLRATDVFPVAGVLDFSRVFGADREQSMAFRFENEDRLFARARERIWFGWGNGRCRVYDETGTDISITDGYWIISLGVAGVVGFFTSFGSLLGLVLLGRRRLAAQAEGTEKSQLAAIALLIGLAGTDLIPNGLPSVTAYLLSGALGRRLAELKATGAAS
jgi:hypothetical protein